MTQLLKIATLGVILLTWAFSAETTTGAETVTLRLTITSPLKFANTPLDPVIDFADFIQQAGSKGVLDPSSIEVVERKTGRRVAHTRSSDFEYGDRGRVEFVIKHPGQREFEIRFRIAARRSPASSRKSTPLIGNGDLLRYNSGRAGPITLFHSMCLEDINGDGRTDLLGTWNYYRRPGAPTGGVVFYAATNDEQPFRFGNLQRLRYRTNGQLHDFSRHYNSAAFADFNADGQLDFLYAQSNEKTARFYLATKEKLPTGVPVFQFGGQITVPGFFPCHAVDLNTDGAIDLVVGGHYIENKAQKWPFRPAAAQRLDAGVSACFADIDGDRKPDAIGLAAKNVNAGSSIVWRRNLGGSPPKFGTPVKLAGISGDNCTLVSVGRDKGRRLLLVQTAFQEIHIYQQVDNQPRFRRLARAESLSAALSLSDQAWPCLRDWDNDGDLDLLIGDGYGRPRIVINEGSRTRPMFSEPQPILSAGKPIRVLRNQLLGPPGNWHDMGYSYPDFVDWDGDGLRDLMLPNETNRLYWYRNTGTKTQPRFGSRQQILCDGYPDSPALRQLSQRRAADPKSNNGVYPMEKERPFFWRTGVAFADFNGDHLMDFVTLDGHKRQATLFTQYRKTDRDGSRLGLRRARLLRLSDGRPIDDRIVNRGKHWGESFRVIDWDQDGRLDLIYSVGGSHHGTLAGASIYLLRNVGSKRDPVFAAPRPMRCFGKPIRITNHGPHPWPADLDGDGRPDLVACVEWSVYPFYRHAALTMKQRPRLKLELVR